VSELGLTPETVLIASTMGGWLAFAIALLGRRSAAGSGRARARRAPLSLLGIGLQGVGFGVASGFHRALAQPLVPTATPLERWLLAAFGVMLTVASVGLALRAVRALGRQWSLQARVLSDHQLVTSGPFALVRHPIYAAMFGLCVVMGLALSTVPALVAALALYGVGTLVRVRSEERLLRGTFGAAYDAYARRVPAVVPWPRAG
jgi:protein-S-isoprenylcysteine O-methyltransferase Ste14